MTGSISEKNVGFWREGGPVGFLGLLFYFSHYYLGFGFFRVIAYLGSCHIFSMIRKTSSQQRFFSPLIILTLSLLHGEAILIRIQPLSPSFYRLSRDVQDGIRFRRKLHLPKMWRNNIFLRSFLSFSSNTHSNERTHSGSLCRVFVRGCASLS